MSTAQLDTKYNWNTLEKKWYSYWLSKNYFHADENSSKETFTIVIPPPNVTGKLTMGHVLNNTIQDILIRKARMEGKNTCWIPGTDHASIATEAKVTKMLKIKGVYKTLKLNRMSKVEVCDYDYTKVVDPATSKKFGIQTLRE